LLARLAEVVDEATKAFDDYNYARALEVTETFFWTFTDDYVELVKERSYRSDEDAAALSAKVTLATALSVLHRLFAPVLPFVTEEVWSWWQTGSIHSAAWPSVGEFTGGEPGDARLLDSVGVALSGIRRAKSDAKVSMRTEVELVKISASPTELGRLRAAIDDLKATGRVSEMTLTEHNGGIEVAVTLGGAQ